MKKLIFDLFVIMPIVLILLVDILKIVHRFISHGNYVLLLIINAVISGLLVVIGVYAMDRISDWFWSD
ncbi:hypothetical protein [Pelosinus sp. IPA-1]|uniref:hypothetical protein n=1 Tax=Pelosinus sp. IPA-1 TaxID=3029569 RepID=UPI0024361B8D|nr:hypothetical protein [Pelosinus sp. IPA-1]GMA99880.1 hypothetical protein PIPA1_26800 [Pelosinus sp. IPA-1]